MRKLIAAVMAVALAVAAIGCGPKACSKCGSTEQCAGCTAAEDAASTTK